ncbi:MAG TPA: AraC family transcriptional regulator, partial [Candidatus Angelobacter sp.]|nr:AraC family transcriptional regulator [Candidatus Angelobacter sp.]
MGSPGMRDSTLQSHYESVERVITVMRNQLDQPMTLHQMARIGFASPYHFSRTFREVTGVPPVQFLYALRLDQAKRLLTETQKKVIDICYEVGYTSVGTFSRRFADVLGVSPVRFRKLIDKRTKASPAATVNGRGQTQTGTRVEGHVTAPGDFRGKIAVGLFHTRIPQGQPVSCAVIEDGGVFELEAVPQGSYYLFAVGLVNPSLSSLSYEHGNALRAGGQCLRVFRNAVHGFTSLQLRPPSPFDPPLLLMLSPQNLACRSHKYPAAAKPGKLE